MKFIKKFKERHPLAFTIIDSFLTLWLYWSIVFFIGKVLGIQQTYMIYIFIALSLYPFELVYKRAIDYFANTLNNKKGGDEL